MARSIPQLIAIAAALTGIALFAVALAYIDLQETLNSVRHLGRALPVVLLPGAAWHLLRTWGWSIAFPDALRPAFTRVFRARLAADAVGFFTVRGIANEPLKVLLLYDRVPPEAAAASVAFERLAVAVVSIAIAGVVSMLAVTRLALPDAWDTLFLLLAFAAVMTVIAVALIARRKGGGILAAIVRFSDRLTGRRFEQRRAVRFVLEVERVLLDLLRGDRRRLVLLTLLPIVCYGVMAAEVWLVFWAIGRPITVMEALTVETFSRLASIASAAVPANLGALEASNVIVVEMLGLAGGGSLALVRRVRALLWAGAGLALYPRVKPRPASKALCIAALTVIPSLAAAGQTDLAALAPPITSVRDAQGHLTVRAIRLAAPLRLDGTLDEPLYTDNDGVSDFIQTEPTAGAQATERTEVWVAFDRARLYVCFRVWESHPERMIVNEMRRDATNILQNEHVSFMLDTFHDRRNSYVFMVSPSGGRIDGQTTNERQYNGDLNPIWDVGVGTFDGGWTAEFAVPFKSLRYAPGASRTWGFMARRVSRWKNEIAYTSLVPDGSGQAAIMRASSAGTLVGLETPPASHNLDIKPFVTAEMVSDQTVSPTLSTDGDAEVGVDAKYSLTQNLAADFTYNTDFAQVEADEQQINVTRFSLFFPEKRDFFLENQGVFAFGNTATAGGGGDTPTVFYSRRIGLEAGQLVPLRAGGRLTGRLGGFELGVLNIQTGREPVSRSASTNFGVIRLKRDLFRRSSVGAIVTRRSGMPGRPSAGETYGVDGTFSFGPSLMINSFWARTATPSLTGDDRSYRAQLDYNADRYGVQLERLVVGDRFNPETGFVRRSDMQKSLAQLRFSPRPKSARVIRKLSWTGALNYIQDGGGRLETREIDGDFSIEFQNSDRVLVGVGNTYEFLPAPFTIARGVTIGTGVYRFTTGRAAVNFGQHRRAFGTISLERGQFYDGTTTGIAVRGARLEVTSRLSLEPTVSSNWIDVAGASFTTRVVGSRITYTVTPLMFTSALVQYNSSTSSLSSNVRLRWEYAPGSELFIVYNDQRDTLTSGFPHLTGRALIVKINRLIRF